MGRKIINRLSLVLAVALCGCNDLFGVPLEYPDAVEYFDEATFTPIWNELESCSKLKRRLRSVGFFHVPHETLSSALHGIRTVGMYFPESNRIFIVDAEMWNHDVIRHEMMHALLKDESGHPAEYFGYDGLCGHI